MAEGFHRLHDRAHALDSIKSLCDRLGDLNGEVVEIQVGRDVRVCLGEQLVDRFPEESDVVADELDRGVDLVRDA